MPVKGSTLTIPAPNSFNLKHAVCSYGYFLLAPNLWAPKQKTLHRTFQIAGRKTVLKTQITATKRSRSNPARIRITCNQRLDRQQAANIRAQVTRMLRLDQDTRTWQRLHPTAKKAGFARLFRSPTLFEDIIKTITGCNVTWPNTMRMNALLCQHIGNGAFPSHTQLAATTPAELKRLCKVGYRAERIIRLARDVAQGRLGIEQFEDLKTPTEALYKKLLTIYGIGPYAAANLCQLLGRYDRLPIDTETYRHFRQQHDLPTPKNPQKIHPVIEAHYAPYAPYQFLAYWFELWQAYESKFGPAHTWTAADHGPNFTAAVLR